MRIIVLSGSPAALPSLRHLYRSDVISALICPEDTIASEVVPLQDWAADKEVPCWQINQQALEADLSELIRETNPDLFLVFGFPYTLPSSLLQPVKHGAWNVHFSLLQTNKGTITIHQLAEEKGEQVILRHNLHLLNNEEAGSPLHQLSLLSVALLHTSLCQLQEEFTINLLKSYCKAVA
jgi:methionyl-tRNA formyltransferase